MIILYNSNEEKNIKSVDGKHFSSQVAQTIAPFLCRCAQHNTTQLQSRSCTDHYFFPCLLTKNHFQQQISASTSCINLETQKRAVVAGWLGYDGGGSRFLSYSRTQGQRPVVARRARDTAKFSRTHRTDEPRSENSNQNTLAHTHTHTEERTRTTISIHQRLLID